MGEFGSTTHIKFFDASRFIFVIRTPRDSCSKLQFVLANICEMKKFPVISRVLDVSGSSRTCRLKLEELYETYLAIDNRMSGQQKEETRASMFQRISAADL